MYLSRILGPPYITPLSRGMFRHQSARKCRAPLACYSLLRCCAYTVLFLRYFTEFCYAGNRTKTSSAAVAPMEKFERDTAPHEGLAPQPDYPRPRAVTHRPFFRQRDRQRDRNDSRSTQQRAAQSPSPSMSMSSSKTPQTAPVASKKRPLTMDDFFRPTQSVFVPSNSERKSSSSDDQLPSEFTSPPLLPALHKSLMETLGPFAHPTPIQSLSLKWILQDSQIPPPQEPNWRQFFLASETGSGKSIAYLLPLLQSIKQAELAENGKNRSHSKSRRLYNPRALILAPTHELTRQLSGFAKSLLHELKLRVLCASQANTMSTKEGHTTSRKMISMFDDVDGVGEFNVSRTGGHGVDVLVGTPMKMLEMVRGRGWDRSREKEKLEEEEKEDDEASVEEGADKKKRRGRDFTAGFGRIKTTELGLQNVEWVVVDEADVLLGMSAFHLFMTVRSQYLQTPTSMLLPVYSSLI